MSETSHGPGWWQASDGLWYPPKDDLPPPYLPPPPPGYGYGYGAPYAGGNWGPIGKRENMVVQFLLALVTCGLYGVYWAYKSHEEVKLHSGEGVGGAVGAVIYFFAGIVTLFLLPIEIQRMYERDGQQSPVSAVTAFWALLLVIPWYVKCQGALNDYWAAKGAPPP